MRVALLSVLEGASDAPHDGIPRGFLRFGAGTVASTQLDLALDLGCTRILCLAHGVSPALIELQRRAEATGAQFHLLRGSRNLASLVGPDDELLVLADGLLALDEDAREMLSVQTVLALPIELGLSHGFERIDLTTAWAGAMTVPGHLVERLFELPEDADAPAALLRIALQARIPQRLLPDQMVQQERWMILASAAEASRREEAWVRGRALRHDPFSPGAWTGERLVAHFGSRLLERRAGSRAALGVGLLLSIGALVAGLAWSVVAGLLLLATAFVAVEGALALERLERPSGGSVRRMLAPLRGLLDMPLAVLLALGGSGQPDWLARFFAPLIVLGLTRLVPRLDDARWTRLVADRAILSLIAALLLAFGILVPGLELYGLGLLACAVALARTPKQITGP